MKGSVATQIDEIEATIAAFESRLDEIERSLRLDDLDAASRKNLKSEVVGLKQQLNDHRSELSSLRTENRKSTLVSLIILTIVIAAYLTWSSQ